MWALCSSNTEKEAEKKVLSMWIFALVRSRHHHTHLFSLSTFLFPQDKEPLGVQKNIWKLVAQKVTQHFIKQEAILNHSPLSSFL